MFKVLLGRKGNTGTCDLLSPADVEVGSPHIHWLWGQISTAHKSPFHAFYSRESLQFPSRLFPIGLVICCTNLKPSWLICVYLCFGSRLSIKTDAKMWQKQNRFELCLAINSWIISSMLGSSVMSDTTLINLGSTTDDFRVCFTIGT